MKRTVAVLAIVLLLALAGCGGEDAAPATDADGKTAAPKVGSGTGDEGDSDALLTPADVESVSGLSGLEVVPYDPAVGAGGDINIADASGQLVAMLVAQGPETWDFWMTDGFTVGSPVYPPVGDESFVGPNPDVSEAPYIFGFLLGDDAIAIDTFFGPGGGTVLSVDQLRALAEIVAGRL